MKLPHIKPRGHWKDIKHQRSFFDQLAAKLNIQKPEDWYTVHLVTVLKEGGSFVKEYYNGSIIKGKVVTVHFNRFSITNCLSSTSVEEV
jgi:hypothetical protein